MILVVMELSSFQLEIMTRSPQVAAVLNLTPNHLDRHGTMKAYTAAKARILDYQRVEDTAVLGCDDPGAWGLLQTPFKGVWFPLDRVLNPMKARLVASWMGIRSPFGMANPHHVLFARETIGLRGGHNLANVLAACAIAHAAGLPDEAMRKWCRSVLRVLPTAWSMCALGVEPIGITIRLLQHRNERLLQSWPLMSHWCCYWAVVIKTCPGTIWLPWSASGWITRFYLVRLPG